MEITIIKIDEKSNEELNMKIEEFAKKSNSANYYMNNRNANMNIRKVLDDIALSKKTEYACKEYLKQFANNISDVDFEIRNSKSKGWEPDLIMDGQHIHVKSCNSITHSCTGDFSWTFQKNNKNKIGGTDILYNPEHHSDICMFTFMNSWENNEIHIKCILKFSSVIPLLREPKKIELKNIKDCLYFKDVIKTYPSLIS